MPAGSSSPWSNNWSTELKSTTSDRSVGAYTFLHFLSRRYSMDSSKKKKKTGQKQRARSRRGRTWTSCRPVCTACTSSRPSERRCGLSRRRPPAIVRTSHSRRWRPGTCYWWMMKGIWGVFSDFCATLSGFYAKWGMVELLVKLKDLKYLVLKKWKFGVNYRKKISW